jgi:hypothetical protein
MFESLPNLMLQLQVPGSLCVPESTAHADHASSIFTASLLSVLVGLAMRQAVVQKDVPPLAAALLTPEQLRSSGVLAPAVRGRLEELLDFILSTCEGVDLGTLPLGLGQAPTSSSLVAGLLALRDVSLFTSLEEEKTQRSVNSRIERTAAFLVLRNHYLLEDSAGVRKRALESLHAVQDMLVRRPLLCSLF